MGRCHSIPKIIGDYFRFDAKNNGDHFYTAKQSLFLKIVLEQSKSSVRASRVRSEAISEPLNAKIRTVSGQSGSFRGLHRSDAPKSNPAGSLS